MFYRCLSLAAIALLVLQCKQIAAFSATRSHIRRVHSSLSQFNNRHQTLSRKSQTTLFQIKEIEADPYEGLEVPVGNGLLHLKVLHLEFPTVGVPSFQMNIPLFRLIY